MKPFQPQNCRRLGWQYFCGAGWLLAGLLAIWVAPRIYSRLINRLPSVQRENWRQVLAEKREELAVRWQDSRPLVIFAGDSEIELGNWYDYFSGAFAVRNCGLSRAKIVDVTELVSVINDPHPQAMVLMCGINNLLRHDSPEASLRDYTNLLSVAQSHLHPDVILVLSVMPVRESAVDRTAHQANETVKHFNASLAGWCGRENIRFLDVTSAVADARGGLADELSIDGLHLNGAGYRRLAALIEPHLILPTIH